MISIEDRFFSLNRTLLMAIGLWPYQKSKFNQLYLICCFSGLASLIIFQLTIFMTSNYTIELAIKIFSSVFAYMTLVIKYNSFHVNAETVKYLLEQIQRIWDDLEDKNEIAVIEKHRNNAKRYTVMLTTSFICIIFIVTLIQIWPNIFHVILSVNNSQSRRLIVMTEYFVDQEKYFHLLLLHQNATLYIGVIGLVATGTMLIAYLQYACEMFQIASYRIKYAMKFHMLQDLPHKNLVYKGMIRAVDIHRKAMMFSTYLINKFEMSFMLMIIFGVGALSLNILQVERGNKSFGLHVGGLFVASLECFATLVNASVSYFTVMYSTR